jgi:PII-like signaling protein
VNDDFLKLTSYFGERHRSDGRLLADALIDLFEGQAVATSIMLRGMTGFGLKQHLRTDRLLTLSEDLPVVAVAVDERQRIQSLAEEVLALKRSGLVTLERAQLLSATSERLRAPARPGEGAKLTIYLGRQERVEGAPAFVAVCDLLHRRGAQGAVAVLGVDGTAHGVRHRARFLSRNANVPMMLIAIAQEEQIAELVPDLGRVLPRPLMTLERVRICKRDGQLLARPPVLAQTDERGLAVWQKLMVYSSEESQHHGEPQHRMIVRRLREQGLRGATVLRGVWGFHGEHEPRGDRLLQLRRRVPVVTIAIDAPRRIAQAFAVIDEMTDETGLVTSEIVPALTALTPDERRGGVRLARRLR